jgi:SNF2 family DNA or RNA helicase
MSFTLLPFQQECVDLLVDQPDVIIGDDMGLGKTIEGIALDQARRKKYPGVKLRTLVIAPMSVVSSWEDHFNRGQPELSTFVLDRKNREAFLKAVTAGTYDVYILHWDVVRLLPELAKFNWFHIIADEAHRVANRAAQVTIRSKKLKRTYLTELTGTPCLTRPEQFWSLLNWSKPRVFTSFHRFFNHHVIYVQHSKGDYCKAVVNGFICGKEHKNNFKVIIGIADENTLLNEIRPYYIRRLKEEVLKDLPEKYYTQVNVDLDPQQRKVYLQMRDAMLAWVGANEDQPLAAPMAIAKLVRLQQLACAYAKIDMIQVKKRDPDTGEFVLIDKERVTLIEPSSKLDAAMEILRDNPEKQFVIFSQSKQVINLLAARLKAKNISHGILTGDTEQADRGRMVEAFQNGELQVFAGTIQAGGVGITLTAASTVIFLDRSWSPAINRQAEDRLHRIGQKSAVQVIDIVARGTIDAGRLQKIEKNWQFIKKLLGDKDAKTKPEGAYI